MIAVQSRTETRRGGPVRGLDQPCSRNPTAALPLVDSDPSVPCTPCGERGATDWGRVVKCTKSLAVLDTTVTHFALSTSTGVSVHASVHVGALVPACNEAGKRVQRHCARAASALRLHWPIPGRRRANTNSCSRSALHSRDGCVRSVVLTRVRIHHTLRTHEPS